MDTRWLWLKLTSDSQVNSPRGEGTDSKGQPNGQLGGSA